MKRSILLILLMMPLFFRCTGKKPLDAAPKPGGDTIIVDANETGNGYEDVGADVNDVRYESSSVLMESSLPDNTFKPNNLFSNSSTSWCEGVKGPGIGEWIKVTLTGEHQFFLCKKNSPQLSCKNKMHELIRIRIMNGLLKSKRLYYANNRVKKLLVEFSGGEMMILAVKDDMNLLYKGVSPAPQVFPVNRIQAKWVKFTILEVYRGSKYNDTCLSELSLGHDDGGGKRPEGSYALNYERDGLVKRIESKYGKLSSRQVEFIKLNITMWGGSGLMMDLAREMEQEPEKFKSKRDVLMRICELNRKYSEECLHPDWIGEE